ncbi:MAG: HAD family hydrolase [Candidatus Altimarinota bacterium]
MKKTAVIFDMDGVISDTQRLHTLSELLVLKEFGLDYDAKAFRNRFAGHSDEDIFAQIFKEKKINFGVKDAVEKKEKILYGKVDEIEAMPGLKDLLEALKNAGVKIGLASGSSKEYIRTVLEKLDIKRYFQAVVSSDEVEMGKPAPDVFLKAAELLGVNPSECVVIEDGRAGMLGARAAGIKVIALTDDKSEDWPADWIIGSLTELNVENLTNWSDKNDLMGGKVMTKKLMLIFVLADLVFFIGVAVYLWKAGVLEF